MRSDSSSSAWDSLGCAPPPKSPTLQRLGIKDESPPDIGLGGGEGYLLVRPSHLDGGAPISWVFPACRQHPHHQSPKLRAPGWLWSQTTRRRVWLLPRGSGLTFSSFHFHQRVKKSGSPTSTRKFALSGEITWLTQDSKGSGAVAGPQGPGEKSAIHL